MARRSRRRTNRKPRKTKVGNKHKAGGRKKRKSKTGKIDRAGCCVRPKKNEKIPRSHQCQIGTPTIIGHVEPGKTGRQLVGIAAPIPMPMPAPRSRRRSSRKKQSSRRWSV